MGEKVERGSVDAAHAINRNLFNQEFLCDDGFCGLHRFGGLSLDVVLFHDYDSTPICPH